MRALNTPSGNPAGDTDRIMLLAMWSRYFEELANNSKDYTLFPYLISAGMGRPTFPLNSYSARAATKYWINAWLKAEQKRAAILGQSTSETHNFWMSDELIKKNSETIPKNKNANIISLVKKVKNVFIQHWDKYENEEDTTYGAVNYGDPQGDQKQRKKIAKAMKSWYGSKPIIGPENILFTVGGAGALHIIFEVINKESPLGRIVTPFPHYSLYAGGGKKNRLHAINVMNEKGYKLTAEALEKSVVEADKLASVDKGEISAFLFCDPNNPLGTIVGRPEWGKIAEILRRYPKAPIIIDEAYAEMQLNGEKYKSLLEIAPDLKERIIIMRSATKGLSAAGERMAIIIAFNELLMTKLLQANIDICGHAPRSLQVAFAEALKRFDEKEYKQMADYYRPKVEFIGKKLISIGANMPDINYKPEGTFYVLADLSDLKGIDLPEKAKKALASNKSGKIETDEDIAYYLLAEYSLMIAPLSYFGVNPKLGYVRITCSGSQQELEDLINRLENALKQARLQRYWYLSEQWKSTLQELEKVDINQVKIFSSSLRNHNFQPATSASELKKINVKFEKMLRTLRVELAKRSEERKNKAATIIQSNYRGYKDRNKTSQLSLEMQKEWAEQVKENCSLESDQKRLLSYKPSERLGYKFWKDHLKNKFAQNASANLLIKDVKSVEIVKYEFPAELSSSEAAIGERESKENNFCNPQHTLRLA